MSFEERLLAKYNEIIGSLEKGEATADLDPEDQQQVAQIFGLAAMQLALQMRREHEDDFMASVMKHREGKGEAP